VVGVESFDVAWVHMHRVDGRVTVVKPEGSVVMSGGMVRRALWVVVCLER
jgi:hypothetical protein